MPRPDFRWLAAGVEGGATPHHNFHVFEVYRRAGLMNGDTSGPVLEVMDGCRISWGEVLEVTPPALTVRRRPLELAAGYLHLGRAVPVRVEAFPDAQVSPGSWVSIHWGWACEVLQPGELRRLRTVTTAALERCNLTL